MLFSLALAVSLAYGAGSPAPKPTLSSLAQKAVGKGQPATLGVGAVRYLRLNEMELHVLSEVPADQTTDGLNHDFYACVGEGAIRCVILATHKKEPPHVRATYFKAELTGRLERVAALAGNLDEEGQPVKGTGQLSNLEPDDSDVLKRFRHELDFWLKDAYRKKADKK